MQPWQELNLRSSAPTNSTSVPSLVPRLQLGRADSWRDADSKSKCLGQRLFPCQVLPCWDLKLHSLAVPVPCQSSETPRTVTRRDNWGGGCIFIYIDVHNSHTVKTIAFK